MRTCRRNPVAQAICMVLTGAALAACSAHGSPFVPAASGSRPGSNQASLGQASSALRARGHGIQRSPLAYFDRNDAPATDIGPRAATQATRVVFVLRYNHEASLRHLVGKLSRTHAYLTPREFAARFEPTPLQEQRAIAALRRAGFAIAQRYPNRLVLDAIAPSATVERFFSTSIHDFRQGRFGTRFAATRPLHVPAAVAPLIATAVVSNVVQMHSMARSPAASTGQNVVLNPGFESGQLAPWRRCGPASAGTVKVVHQDPQAGSYDALVLNASEKATRVAVCQLVTVPPQATLTVWSRSAGASRATQQFGAVYSEKGALLQSLWSVGGKRTARTWIEHTSDLSAFSGRKVNLEFGVLRQTGKVRGKIGGQYIDSVSLTGNAPTPAPTAEPSITPVPPPTPIPGMGPDNGWGPSFVSSAFDMPSNDGYTGSGQTVAIVIDGTVSPSDLATYLGQYHISQTGSVATEPVDGGDGEFDQLEATLDLETIASLAPAASVIIYDTPDLSDQSIIDAYDQIVSDAKATVVNSSFGGCESNDSTFTMAVDAIAAGAAAMGTTFSASSGDTGSDCFAGSFFGFAFYSFGASAPASSPNFVAVGGTESVSPAFAAYGGYGCTGPATSIANPVVLNDCVGQGGSGVSTFFPTPGYQGVIAGSSPQGRNVPDISLPAAYDDMYDSSAGLSATGWFPIWGTSWSSPIYVAMQAEINQICGRPVWGIGALYGAFARGGYRDFIDVTNGNDNPNTGDTYYTATNGFDVASGIGMPLGLQIAADNGCVAAPASRREGVRHG